MNAKSRPHRCLDRAAGVFLLLLLHLRQVAGRLGGWAHRLDQDILFVGGGALIGLPPVLTLLNRKVGHLYVSVWYVGCALFWFSVLFLVANIPGLHKGVQQGAMNRWFGHNVLGLFYTPLALASAYYFLSKVIGGAVQSYNLSHMGFCSLAFFYGQVGGHHLIGGPVPSWMTTLSIVQSMMMPIPVVAFTINQHQTLKSHLSALRFLPTLRFIGFDGLVYTASSIQGSFDALRSINIVTRFTHYTVAASHHRRTLPARCHRPQQLLLCAEHRRLAARHGDA